MPTLHIGEIVGPYRIVRAIGHGGMAEVFEAEHVSLGRASRAAIKVLMDLHRDSDEYRSRFLNEAAAASLVQDPGVVHIVNTGHTASGLPCIFMEYLDGESFWSRFSRLEGLGERAPALWVRRLREVASALVAVHALGIVHRDLKAGNLFIVTDREAADGERSKVIDFGIAKVQVDHWTLVNTVFQTAPLTAMGTPQYMSPEQCTNASTVTTKADVYSLGVVAYEVFSGQLPFPGPYIDDILRQHVRDAPAPLSRHCPDLPADLLRLVDQMLEKRPDRRPTMQEVAERLEACEAELSAAPPAAPVAQPLVTTPQAPPTLVTRASAPPATQLVFPASPRPRPVMVAGLCLGAILLGLLLALGLG